MIGHRYFSGFAPQAEDGGRQGEDDDGDAQKEPRPQAADGRPADGGGDRDDGGQPEVLPSCMEVFIRPEASPRSPVLPEAAMVRGTLESMKPNSPTTVPQSTVMSPSLSDIRVMRSSPAPSSVRPPSR